MTRSYSRPEDMPTAKYRRQAWEFLVEPGRWIYYEPVAGRMKELQPVVDEIEAGITEIIRPVLDRAAILMLADTRLYKGPEMVKSIGKLIKQWAKAVVDTADLTGPVRARQIVQVAYGDRIPPEFWATHLGQLVFFRDGFPDRPVSRTEARFIFGGVTRQAVDKATDPACTVESRRLINADEKAEDDEGRVLRFLTRDSVYRRWHGIWRIQDEKMMLMIRHNEPLAAEPHLRSRYQFMMALRAGGR